MMKKLFAMVIVMITALFTGCGSATTPVREINGDVTYYNIHTPNPDYSKCELSEDAKAVFDAVCEAERVVIENVYGLTLKRENINVYYTDNIPEALYGQEPIEGVYGYYSVELNQVFIDSSLKDNMPKMMGVMAHEAIHYLYAANNDTDNNFFSYRNGDGEELGDALIEGLTQRIALNNLLILENNGYCQGAYNAVIRNYYLNTRVSDLLCNYAVKDMDRYYLTNDFDSARKAFNDSVGNQLSSEYEPFELFENALQKAQGANDSNQAEVGMKYLEDAVWLVALSVNNSSADNKKAFLSEFDSLGSFSEDYSKSIHHLLE